MRTFAIEGDKWAPHIFIDETKRTVEISGNSILKEPQWFYCNLLKWLIAFNLGPNKTEIINVRLSKINDSSSKWLALVLNKLSKVLTDSHIEVNWYLASENRRIHEGGQMVSELPGFRVNLVS